MVSLRRMNRGTISDWVDMADSGLVVPEKALMQRKREIYRCLRTGNCQHDASSKLSMEATGKFWWLYHKTCTESDHLSPTPLSGQTDYHLLFGLLNEIQSVLPASIFGPCKYIFNMATRSLQLKYVWWFNSYKTCQLLPISLNILPISLPAFLPDFKSPRSLHSPFWLPCPSLNSARSLSPQVLSPFFTSGPLSLPILFPLAHSALSPYLLIFVIFSMRPL